LAHLSAAERKWWESGGLKFRFLRGDFLPLPALRLFFLLRFCSFWVARFVIEPAAKFSSGLRHDECPAPTTQVPLLQSILPSRPA
jgi:hypothetical protein